MHAVKSSAVALAILVGVGFAIGIVCQCLVLGMRLAGVPVQ